MNRLKIFAFGVVIGFHSWIFASPAQVIVIRHAEKPVEGVHLSLKGRERAAALVPFFQGSPATSQYGKPIAIYASSASHEESSMRSIETVRELANALNMKVNDNYRHGEYAEMVKEIMSNTSYDGKMILIAWEHHDIPDIVKEFGVESAPKKWPGEVFDRLWVINFDDQKGPYFRNLPQRLMFGDSAQ